MKKYLIQLRFQRFLESSISSQYLLSLPKKYPNKIYFFPTSLSLVVQRKNSFSKNFIFDVILEMVIERGLFLFKHVLIKLLYKYTIFI